MARAESSDGSRRGGNGEELAQGAQLLDAVAVAVIATDLAGTVMHWNRAAEAMYGWTAAEALGRSIVELTVGSAAAEATAEVMAVLAETGLWEREFNVRRKNGTAFPAYVRGVVYRDQDGRAEGIIGVSFDISERVERERELRAARDYMRAVAESMGESLFVLDDTGRLTFVNPAAASLLGWSAADLAAGDLHDVAHFQRADGSPLPRDECPIISSRSEGRVARVDDDVFTRRDGSLIPVSYTAAPFITDAGASGTVVVVRDISRQKAEELRLQDRLRHLSWAERIGEALEHERFVLYAQPIVDLATGAVAAHELLIRMRDAANRIVAPGQFLPTAEEVGLIRQIDEWVVHQAAVFAGRGHTVTMNLSAASFARPDMADVIEGALAQAGADPGNLVLELTETSLLKDELGARRFTERVVARGVQIALDDFGTGYGGFTYLKHVPVHYIKIDKEFVRDIGSQKASKHVVRAVVSLAGGFGQRTVAEGVERRATVKLLGDLGVDYGQGYALGRPAPAESLLADGRQE